MRCPFMRQLARRYYAERARVATHPGARASLLLAARARRGSGNVQKFILSQEKRTDLISNHSYPASIKTLRTLESF